MDSQLPSRWSKSTSPSQRIDDLFERFELAWKKGQTPDIGTFLEELAAEPDLPAARDLLINLVGVDLEWRWRTSGEASTGFQAEPAAGNFSADNGPPEGDSPTARVLPSQPRLADYVAQFEQLGSVDELSADLLAHEYWVRHRWGDRPTRKQFCGEYGRDDSKLCAAIEACDDELSQGGGNPDDTVDYPGRPEEDSEEKALILAAMDGKHQAMERLLLRNYDWLLAEAETVLRNIGAENIDAKDVVQAVHALAFHFMESSKPDKNFRLHPWLTALTVSVADMIRERKEEQTGIQPSAEVKKSGFD